MLRKNTGKTPFQPITNKKSQKLTTEERAWLRRHIKNSETIEAAGAALSISRNSIYNICVKGSGAPENINKIREAFKQQIVEA